MAQWYANNSTQYRTYLTIDYRPYDILTNTTPVSVKLEAVKLSGSGYWNFGTSSSWSLNIGGNTRSGSFSYDFRNYTRLTLFEGIFNIVHEEDGTKILSSVASVNLDGIGSASINQNLTLPTIPRASTVSVVSGQSLIMGNNINLSITRHVNTFTHKIEYRFSADSVWTLIGNNVTIVATWSSPDVTELIPNEQVGQFVIRCTTFQGSTQIGEPTELNVNLSVDTNAVRPTLDYLIRDINPITLALTGNNQIIVRNASNVSIEATPISKRGTSLTRLLKSTTGFEKVYTNPASGQKVTTNVNGVLSSTFTLTVQDSRGLSVTANPIMSAVDYVPLTLSIIAVRDTPTNNKVKIDYVGSYFNGNFPLVANTLELKFRYRVSGNSTWSSYVSIDSPVIVNGQNKFEEKGRVLNGTFDYRNIYEFEFVATDKIMSVTSARNVARGKPIISWAESMFKVWNKLICNGDVLIKGVLSIVGSITTQGTLYQKGNKEVIDFDVIDSTNGIIQLKNNSKYLYPNVLAEDSEVVLYDYEQGTRDAIPLNETVANFEYIEIYFMDNNRTHHSSMKIYKPNGKRFDIFLVEASTATATYVRRTKYQISGTLISPQLSGGGGFFLASNSTVSHSGGGTNYIFVYRVVGYK